MVLMYIGILNISDYTRFASDESAPVLSQAITIPIMTTLTALVCDLFPSSYVFRFPRRPT